MSKKKHALDGRDHYGDRKTLCGLREFVGWKTNNIVENPEVDCKRCLKSMEREQ